MTDRTRELALDLLQTQRTMVLATADPAPWTAPVYYVYQENRCYFFSSAQSRHILAAGKAAPCAAAIFRDGDNWRDIEGLQMAGRIEEVCLGREALQAYRSYLRRFPTVQELLADAVLDLAQFLAHFRTQLYAFVPDEVYYLNNRAGLEKRQRVEWPL